MRNRAPFKTNAISAIHNLILTFWSLAMSVGAGYYGFKRAMVRIHYHNKLSGHLCY